MRNRPKNSVIVFRSDTLGTFCPLWVTVPRRGMRRAVERLRRFGPAQSRQHDTAGVEGRGCQWRSGQWVAPWDGNRYALLVTRTGKTVLV